jgi:transposase
MAKLGILPTLADMFGPGGQKLLDEMAFEGAYAIRIAALRDLLEIYGRELTMIEQAVARRLRGNVGYHAVQAINGVGPVMASIFVAEIGDVSRFRSAGHLCSWAGLTPTHRESDIKVTRGHITKQAATSCAGPPSRPSPTTTVEHRSLPPTPAWRLAGER